MWTPSLKRKAKKDAEAQPPRVVRPAFAEAAAAQEAPEQQTVLPVAAHEAGPGARNAEAAATPQAQQAAPEAAVLQPLHDWWGALGATESLEENRARMRADAAAREAARLAKQARLLAAHEAGEPLPLSDVCAALKDMQLVRLLCARTDEARSLAAALLAPLATPALHAFIAAGGDAPEDSGEDEAMDEDAPAVQPWTYLLTLNITLHALEDGWLAQTRKKGVNMLSEECVRLHLPVLALMFRHGAHDTLLFSVASYGIQSWRAVAEDFHCPVVQGQSAADCRAARAAAVAALALSVITAAGAALVAALPHAQRFKAFPEETLSDLVGLGRFSRPDGGPDSGVCCAALRKACSDDALLRLVAALGADAAFPEHSHSAAIDVVCALVKQHDNLRDAALGAGLGRALARSVRCNPEALRGMIKACEPAAAAAFDAGAAAELVAVLDAQNYSRSAFAVHAVKSAAKAGYATHLIDAGVLPQLVAYFALHGKLQFVEYYDRHHFHTVFCAVHALFALLSENEDDEEQPLAKHAVDVHILAAPGALAVLLRSAGLPPSPQYAFSGNQNSYVEWLLGQLLRVAPVATLQAAVLDGAVPLRHLPQLMAHRKARRHALTMLRMCRNVPAVLTLLRMPPPAREVPAALAVLALAETEAVLIAQQADNDAPSEHFFLRLLAEGDRVAMCVQSGLAGCKTAGAGAGEPHLWSGDESARKWRGRLADCDARADYGVLHRLLQLADPVILPASAHVARLVARAVERVVAGGDTGAGLSLVAAAVDALADGADTTASEGMKRWTRKPAPRTLARTLRAGLDATADRGALVTAACVRMLLRRMAAGEDDKPALRDCCYFGWNESAEARWGPARCSVCCSTCPKCAADAEQDEDGAAEKPVVLSSRECIAFEAELVAAFQARLAERLSWERPAGET